ncbi:MAG: ATP-dependent DNA helicase [Deltaproteobacteria bacterium]|jgi:ATP-dependent DNA helicase DinG|nr:ATP-dependent DNA helicase [Deltaproteobacteria bacterium]
MVVPLPNQFPHDLRELRTILDENGPLSKQWTSFEPRSSQQEMFLEAARAFKSGDISLIEAGTGTGKTLAYLLPAIISKKKTIVSTGLKNLQEQIYEKDLAFIRENFNVDFKATILKGRDNYLCLRAYHILKKRFDDVVAPTEDHFSFKELSRWIDHTESGELDELSSFIKLVNPFDRLFSKSDTCMGQTCKYSAQCFLNQARKKAKDASIILVNHHLFLADLVIRNNQSQVSILPEWDAVIFDEAHLLENIATQYFSFNFSAKDFLNLLYGFTQLIDRAKSSILTSEDAKEKLENIVPIIEDASGYASILLNNYQNKSEEQRLWPFKDESEWDDKSKKFKLFLMTLSSKVEDLSKRTGLINIESEDIKPIIYELIDCSKSLEFIYSNSDPSYVYQVKGTKEDVQLAAIPINVAPYLSDKLFSKKKTIILTSATMSVKNKMDYFQEKLGIEGASPNIFPSPYDYQNRTLLYIPTHLPPPTTENNDKFTSAIIPELIKLLSITKGRALVLFTSHSRLDKVHAAITTFRHPFRIYKQGEAPRSDLLDKFKKDMGSVLMATTSFWQGVDVPGQSLSAVIIDKIPFPRPDTPLSEAKKRLIESEGGNFFNTFFMPEAIILLKQGLGRLLRCKTDKGLLAILDSRLINANYGKTIVKNLPNSSPTNDIERVAGFFQDI